MRDLIKGHDNVGFERFLGEERECSDEYPDIVEMGIELLAAYNNKTVTPQWPKIDPK